MSKTIIKALTLAIIILIPFSTAQAAPFTDVDEGSEHYMAIKYLKENGIIDGYDDGSFKPNNWINRAEALKMLTIASRLFDEKEMEGKTVEEDVFKDVKKDAWFAPYIEAAKEKEIIEGYEDGSYKPGNNITLAEGLKIYLECYGKLNYPDITPDTIYGDTPVDDWPAKYMAFAKSHDMLNISANNEVYPDREMTRGYMAEIIYRLGQNSSGYGFGKATWYGEVFHGRTTASGKLFDKDGMTAAHKTLPFGTILEVTNLANGKSIEVEITDRGPYGYGRVIDLSSGAFKEIASLGSGVIYVQFIPVQ